MAQIIIEDGGFRLEEVDIGSDFFDLYGRKKIAHKDGTETIEWKILAYGIPINEAILRIINCRIGARHPEIMNLKEFFTSFKEERKKVIEDFSLQTLNLTKDLIQLNRQIKSIKKDGNIKANADSSNK